MQGKYWCFTINNYVPEDDPCQWVGSRTGVSYVVYQKEKGASGTPHLQGYCELTAKKKLGGMKKIHPRACWDIRKGTQAQAIAYCKKQDETYVAGPWEEGHPFVSQQGKRTDIEAAAHTARDEGLDEVVQEYPAEYAKYHAGMEKLAQYAHTKRLREEEKSEFTDAVLRPWQKDLADKLKSPPDDRKIFWIWESTGNVGKTWMARYMQAMHDATVLDCSKKADLNYMLRSHRGKVVVFNIVRSIDTDYMGHVYGVAESIKDQLVLSTKYESQRIILGKQHVVIFANIEPDRTKWSEDRYDVTKVIPDALSTLSDAALTVPKLKRARQKEPESPGCKVCGTGFCICSQAGRGPQYRGAPQTPTNTPGTPPMDF